MRLKPWITSLLLFFVKAIFRQTNSPKTQGKCFEKVTAGSSKFRNKRRPRLTPKQLFICRPRRIRRKMLFNNYF